MMRNEAKCGVFAKGLKIPDEMNGIPRVTQETPYKYLGIEMEETSQARTLKERMKEYQKDTHGSEQTHTGNFCNSACI